MHSAELVWQQVHWPLPLQPAHALGLLHHLASHALHERIVWEARGQNGQVSHFVGTAPEHAHLIGAAIRSLVPGAQLSKDSDERTPPPRVAHVRIQPVAMRLASDRQATAVRALLAALSHARQSDEAVVLQAVLGRALAPRMTAEVGDPTRSWFEQLADASRSAPSEIARQIRDKRAEPGFDVAIRVGELQASTMIARRIGTYRFRCVAAPAYAAQVGLPATPDELRQHRCILNLNMSPRNRWPFIGPGGASVIAEVEGGLQIDNGEAQLAAAQEGAGIVYLPVDLVTEPLRAGRLLEVLPHWQRMTLPIHLVYPSRRLVPRRLSAFMEAIATGLKDTTA